MSDLKQGDREALLAYLRDRHDNVDEEIAHFEADRALLTFIDDEEITRAFEAIPRWYA